MIQTEFCPEPGQKIDYLWPRDRTKIQDSVWIKFFGDMLNRFINSNALEHLYGFLLRLQFYCTSL